MNEYYTETGCGCPNSAPIMVNGQCSPEDVCTEPAPEPRPDIVCGGGATYFPCAPCAKTCDNPNPACPKSCRPGKNSHKSYSLEIIALK